LRGVSKDGFALGAILRGSPKRGERLRMTAVGFAVLAVITKRWMTPLCASVTARFCTKWIMTVL
jgi:hypothetical protein